MRRKLIHEFTDGPNRGKFRECTQEELDDALAKEQIRIDLEEKIEIAKKALKELKKGCTHPVCYDTAGMPYDVRHCIICGDTSLL